MAYYLISEDFASYLPETEIVWTGTTYYYNTEDSDKNPAFSELGMGLNVASGDEVTVLAGSYDVTMSSGWYTNSGAITISNRKYTEDPEASPVYADTEITVNATLKNNGTLVIENVDPAENPSTVDFSIAKLTNAGTVSIAGALVDATTFTNNGSVSIANTAFDASSVTNGEGKTFTLENSTFTALNTIVNDGTFYVTNSDVYAEFDGGEISLTGTFGDGLQISGAADITATKIVVTDGSISGSKITSVADSATDIGIALGGTASISADEVVANARIYASGENTLDFENVSGSAIISARNGATLVDSNVNGTVYFDKNTAIAGDSYIKTISIKGTSTETTSAGYRNLTISGKLESDKIDTGTSAGTKPNSAFIYFNDATADLGTLAVTGQSVITVTDSKIGAGVVNLSGNIVVAGESSLVFEKVSPNTAYGDSTINAGGATLSDTSIAKTSATFAVAEATTLTLKGENSILANIDNQGIITLASKGTGDEFEAAFLEGSVSTGNIVIAEGAVVLDDDPETAAPKSAQLIKGAVSAEITNNAGYNNFKDSTGYYLTVENRNTLFVNPDYELVGGSAVMDDGHILGYNAFNSFTAAMKTAALYSEVNAISLADDITAESNATITLPFSKDLTIGGPNTATIIFSGNNDLIITVTEDNKITLAEGTTLKTTGADGYIVLGGAGSYDVQGTVDSVSQVAFWTDATVGENGKVVSEYTGANTGMVLFRSAKQGAGDGVVIDGGSVDTGRAFLVSGKLTADGADFNASVLQFTQNLDEASATPWWASEVVNENGEALLGAKFVLTSTDSVWTIGDIEAAGDNAVIDGEFTFTGGSTVNVSGNANLGEKITLKLSSSTFTAGELVNDGTVSVRGADNTLNITDLDGRIAIETAGGNTTLLGSQIGDTEEVKNGIVEIYTADSGKGVYFKGLSNVSAKIENNGRMYVGASSGEGFLTFNKIENKTGAALTVRNGSQLGGGTIVNTANNTLTVNGTLVGVTVQRGSIATTSGFTFAGASKLEGVTINKPAATLAVNGNLTVDTASTITVDSVTVAEGGSITITAAEGFDGIKQIFILDDADTAAALLPKVTGDGVFVAQSGKYIYAAAATPTTQNTIVVDSSLSDKDWGYPYEVGDQTYFVGINAFSKLSDALSAASAANATTIKLMSDAPEDLSATSSTNFAESISLEGGKTATLTFSGNKDIILSTAAGKTFTLAAGTTLETEGADGYIVLSGAGSYEINGTLDSVSQVAFWTGATVSTTGKISSVYTAPNTGMVLFRSANKGGDAADVTITGDATATTPATTTQVTAGRTFLVSGKLTTSNAKINAGVIDFTQNVGSANEPIWASEVVDTTGESPVGKEDKKFVLESTNTNWTIAAIEDKGDDVKIKGEFGFTGGNVNVSGDANLNKNIELSLNGADMEAVNVSNAGTINLSKNSELVATGTVTNVAGGVINVGKAGDAQISDLTAKTIDNSGTINVGTEKVGTIEGVAASLTGSTVANSGTINAYSGSVIEIGAVVLNNNAGDEQAEINLNGSTISGANGVYMNLGNGVFNVNGATVSKLGINTAYEDAPDGKAEIVIKDSVINLGTGSGTSVINATKAKRFTIEGKSTVVARINGTVTLLDGTTLTDSIFAKYGSKPASTTVVADNAEVAFSGTNSIGKLTVGTDAEITVDGTLTSGTITNNGTITINGSLSASAISKVGSIVMDATDDTTDTLTVTNAISGGTIAITIDDTFVAGTTLITAGSGLLGTTITINGIEVGNGDTVLDAYTVIKTDKTLSLVELASTETLYVNKDYSATDAGGHAWGVNAFVFLTSAINNMADDTETIVVESSRVATGLSNVTIAPKAEAGTLEITGEDVDVELGFKGADQGLYLTPGVEISGVNITTTATDGDAWTGSVYVNFDAAAGTVTIAGDITAAGHIYFRGSADVTGDLKVANDRIVLLRAGKAGANNAVTIGRETKGTTAQVTGTWIELLSGKANFNNTIVDVTGLAYNNYTPVDGEYAAAPALVSDKTDWTLGFIQLDKAGLKDASFTFQNESTVTVNGAQGQNADHKAAAIGSGITFTLDNSSLTMTNADSVFNNAGTINLKNKAKLTTKKLENFGTITTDATATVISAKEIFNGEDAELDSVNINAGVEGVTNNGIIKAGSIVAGGTIGNVGTIEAGSVSATYIENSGTFTASGEENVVSGKFNNMAGGSVTLKDGVSLGTADAKISLIGNSKNAAKFEVLDASVYATQLQNLADFTVEGTTATATFNVGTVRNTSTLTFKGNVALTIGTIATGTGYKGITLDGANLFDASVGGAYTTTVDTDSAFNGKSSFSSLTVDDDAKLTINAAEADCLTVTDLNSTGSIYLHAEDDLFAETNLVRVITVSGEFNVGPITTDEGYSVIIQDTTAGKEVYLLSGAPTSMETIVLDITWGNQVPIGETVNFGGNEYTYGVDAFTWATQLVNLTTETTTIKFRTSDVSYGALNLARANVSGLEEVAPLDVTVTRVDGTGVGTTAVFDDTTISTDVDFDVKDITFGALTISGSTVTFNVTDTQNVIAGGLDINNESEVDFEGNVTINGGAAITGSRVNFGEEDKDSITTISGNVTITDADVDFDDVTKIGIEGSEEPVLVTIEDGSEVEFDRDTTIYGSLTLEAGSMIEANQGYTFKVSGATINGALLVGNEDDENDDGNTAAELGAIVGGGTIYTDINSALNFNGTGESGFTGEVYINVSGLTAGNKQFQTIVADADATFVVTGTGVVDGTSFRKYFTYDESGLTQIGRAANVYEATVSTQTQINDAVSGTGWNADGGAVDPAYFVDNVTLTGDFAYVKTGGEGLTSVFLDVNNGQNVILKGNFGTAVYGGEIYVSTTSRAGTWLGGDINVTVDSGTYSRVVVGGDRISVASGRANFFRSTDEAGDNLAEINLTINGGLFKSYVAAGVMYEGENLQGSVEVGSTNLEIYGGTFMKDVYGGNYGTKKAASSCTFAESSNVTLTVGGDEKITFQKALFVGSFGSGRLETTTLTLTGVSEAKDALTATEIWAGGSSDYYKETATSRTYETAVSGARTLSFTGFDASVACNRILGFSDVIVQSNGEELGDDDRVDTNAVLSDKLNLSDVSNWTFEFGSSLNGAFQNDFAGDKLALTGIEAMTTGNSWVICDNINFETFAFEGIKSINGVTGDDLVFADNAYTFGAGDNQYKLSFGDYNVGESEETSSAMYLTRLA